MRECTLSLRLARKKLVCSLWVELDSVGREDGGARLFARTTDWKAANVGKVCSCRPKWNGTSVRRFVVGPAKDWWQHGSRIEIWIKLSLLPNSPSLLNLIILSPANGIPVWLCEAVENSGNNNGWWIDGEIPAIEPTLSNYRIPHPSSKATKGGIIKPKKVPQSSKGWSTKRNEPR